MLLAVKLSTVVFAVIQFSLVLLLINVKCRVLAEVNKSRLRLVFSSVVSIHLINASVTNLYNVNSRSPSRNILIVVSLGRKMVINDYDYDYLIIILTFQTDWLFIVKS